MTLPEVPQIFESPAIIGVVTGIVANLVCFFLFWVPKGYLSFRKARKGVLTGAWEQLIYDEAGNLVKKDIVDCWHVGERIIGRIRRLEPAGQSYKQWKFEGKLNSKLFFGIFWTTVRQNPESCGTLQMYVAEDQLEGFYVRLTEAVRNSPHTHEISLTKINFKWQRKSTRPSWSTVSMLAELGRRLSTSRRRRQEP